MLNLIIFLALQCYKVGIKFLYVAISGFFAKTICLNYKIIIWLPKAFLNRMKYFMNKLQ